MQPRFNDLPGEMLAKAGGVFSLTAGAGTDNVEKEGAWIDRSGFNSMKAVIVTTATLAATKTLTIAANLEDASASDQSDKADYGDAMSAAVVATGGTGGSTELDVIELDFDLASAGKYVRLLVTPDLSATGTDTAIVTVAYVLTGAIEVPATARAN